MKSWQGSIYAEINISLVPNFTATHRCMPVVVLLKKKQNKTELITGNFARFFSGFWPQMSVQNNNHSVN